MEKSCLGDVEDGVLKLLDSELSRMTPRVLTRMAGEMKEWSSFIVMSVLERVDLVPMSRASLLLLFNLREL